MKTSSPHTSSFAMLALGLVLLTAAAVPAGWTALQREALAQAGTYAGQLDRGLAVVRLGLALAGVLSFLTAGFIHVERKEGPPAIAAAKREKIGAWTWALLLLIPIAVRIPRLSDAFLWDELTTLLRFVRRSWLVVLSFSGIGNNHVLNSVLAKLSVFACGEQEWALRLPAFILGAILPAVAYRMLRERGRAVALTAALACAAHATLVDAATQARGYSGAILCAYLATWQFSNLWLAKGGTSRLAYVCACVAGCGFQHTFLIVPLSHGLFAAGSALAQAIRTRNLRVLLQRPAFGLALSCLWSGVGALVLFGIQLPQILDYGASGLAQADHRTLGVPLLRGIACYVAGVRNGPAACLLFAASFLVLLLNPALRRSHPGPLVVFLGAALWLLIPGLKFSGRLFFFLLPAFTCGLANGSAGLRPGFPRWLMRGLLAAWAVIQLQSLGVFLSHRNPDLRALGGLVAEHRVALYDQQADVNRYYFPDAETVFSREELSRGLNQDARWDFIVHGTYPSVPADPLLASRGYRLVHTLKSFRPGPSYRVYAQDRMAARPGGPAALDGIRGLTESISYESLRW